MTAMRIAMNNGLAARKRRAIWRQTMEHDGVCERAGLPEQRGAPLSQEQPAPAWLAPPGSAGVSPA
ncbi:MAG: hypothetical protein GEU90_19250 [Gemmatimonas sp.]|nr:hypothetical protein [Gemmatimonas sp.]